MTNLDSVLRSRDNTLPTKVHLVKGMVFPVVMYGCESWTIKKAERQKTDAFELWCWRRILRVPWTARRSNQSILKEIGPEYSLKGLMLKLKSQYFGHLMWRTDSLEKTWCWERLRAGGEGDNRGWDDWMASLTQWTWVKVNSGSWWWTGRPGVLQSMGSQSVGHYWTTELTWKSKLKKYVSKTQLIMLLWEYVQITKTELAFNACIRSNSEATYTLLGRTETLIKELKNNSQFLPFVYGLHGWLKSQKIDLNDNTFVWKHKLILSLIISLTLSRI